MHSMTLIGKILGIDTNYKWYFAINKNNASLASHLKYKYTLSLVVLRTFFLIF